MTASKTFISIVLPLYRPKGNWAEKFIQHTIELRPFLPRQLQVEWIVVYDDAIDASLLPGFSLLRERLEGVQIASYGTNRGKGYALREGVRLAHSPHVLTMDFDFPYHKENIAELIAQLQGGFFDIVVGRRSPAYFSQVPWQRKLISKLFSRLNRSLLRLPLCDAQSGIKGFNLNGREQFLQTTIDRFLVDTEFVMRSSRQGLFIKTIDIELRPGILFSSFGLPVLMTELRNFVQLLLLNKKLKTGRKVMQAPYALQHLPAS